MKFLEIKAFLKPLCFLCVLIGSVLAFAVDREAFSITNYDLNLQIDPSQHRLGVRGKITLRNDTAEPQKIAVLQISSSLDWRTVRAADKTLQFVRQPYASDIDHTGALSEAIVTLPEPVAPHHTIDLDIAYEGLILPDATRLTRIGMPDEVAKAVEWDQLDANFSAIRGAGHVAWYPIATEVANLSEGSSLLEVLARWKTRESGAKAHLKIAITREGDEDLPELVLNHARCEVSTEAVDPAQLVSSDCRYDQFGPDAPAIVIANYDVLSRTNLDVHELTGHEAAATAYADAADKVAPLIAEWFGAQREKAQVADLPQKDDAPFESGALLLAPLTSFTSSGAALSAAHQLTHASFFSSRPWIEEGLAHFAQALYLEQQSGRKAAIDYMGLHRNNLVALESAPDPTHQEDTASRSLVNTLDEEMYRSKAMSVWWMLRDMLGDAALKKAIAAYKPEQDKDPSYMQHLIAAQTQRDLEWFFDDWVYRDRGLPDFKVESAFSRKALNGTFVLTVTLENLGSAGAEVSVIVKCAGGDVIQRLEVRAKSKASIRVQVPAAPQEVVVNDGSVPESDMTNNSFKVEAAKE